MNYNEEECNACCGLWYIELDNPCILEECPNCKGTDKIVIEEY